MPRNGRALGRASMAAFMRLSLVIERHGHVVSKQFSEGKDASTCTVIPSTTRFDVSTRSTLRSIPAACVHRLDYSCPNIEATLYAP